MIDRRSFPPYCWLLLAPLLFWQSVQAEQVGNLYEAESAVVGQGTEARAKGIKNTFAQVLVKVSGDRSLLSNPEIDGLLRKASSYVQQYRYRMLDDKSAEPDADQPDRILWARFDERAVNRLLRQSGVPVWGTTRPSVLIWLGEESGTSRSLVSLERQPQLKRMVKHAANDRGLPVLLPLMDMEDRAALPVSDLWGGFETDIRRASNRYLPDVILVGRLRGRGGNDWQGQWTLYLPDKVNRWQTRANSKYGLLNEGLQQAADALALRFAPQQVSEGSTTLRIRIHGLSQLSNYVLVKDYLQSLAMIEQLDLLAADPENVSFLAKVQGSREVLERGIQLGAVLEPVLAQEPTVTEDNTVPVELEGESLNYRLR
ncbi:MAG: DUF2066 domain-containing protein [Candidatus Thiodiazotropha sp. (ex Myrtea spinifera)]|nr:DUF2066 domain-containing protein [Candidatus Thiodiazotropha sp. (ex Myrtea spinifera)]